MKTTVISLLLASAFAALAGETNETAYTYRLAANDVVEVKVYRQPDLDTRSAIANTGKLTMPLLGGVAVAGQTVEEARQTIRQLLAKEYLVNPQVTLTVVEYGKRLFTVMGEVQRPGAYEIPPDHSVNLLQAVAMAGGFTRLGASRAVIVHRVEGDQKKVYKLDAAAMAQDETREPFLVLPGDTITVRERVF